MLVDCDSFYCSCERLFSPQYQNTPIIVLSNNDGCIISASKEAKELGIKIGDPLFQVKGVCTKYNIKIYSSNMELYTDISRRIMTILSTYSSMIEVYSIDEAFILIDSKIHKNELITLGHNLRNKILNNIGIPVSVGIASTKTLSKVAVKLAKDSKGVECLLDNNSINNTLNKIPIGDIWGIGKSRERYLTQLGLNKALAFKIYSKKNILRKHGTKVLLQVQDELNGTISFQIEPNKYPKQQEISFSRTFKSRINNYDQLLKILSSFVSILSQKLRRIKKSCLEIEVLISNDYKSYSSEKVKLSNYTNDTRKLEMEGKKILERLLLYNSSVKKLGVRLMRLIDNSEVQLDIFSIHEDLNSDVLMSTIDNINKKFGDNSLYFASENKLMKKKLVKSNYKSPSYTTQWEDLPLIL